MLSKSAARTFFLAGTGICFGAFVLLTIDTISRVPDQTNESGMTESVIRGKHIWESKNCMGCHTLYGEGAYYAPELTKVFERRGETFIRAILKDPEAMYPGERKMINYNFEESEIDDLVEFFKWVGNVDLNGFPPKADLMMTAVPTLKSSQAVAPQHSRPQIFNQMCTACHRIKGQGGSIGPALDGVGSRLSREKLVEWLADPTKVKPGSKMPKLPLTSEQINELAAFLSQMKAEGR